ncbi:TetR/AcrR family transcriptional regulator [Paramicrobacterium fandaimingii]|uniref:TetR/AcrR family transcriptional regulator n=1 Tax=Paramicrobacterium fandaimingii TaxID=2708079 RepID=UPI001421D604|nr:TetR/AcrR family transcriptional regulator [Microbacterium fandaimingii]
MSPRTARKDAAQNRVRIIDAARVAFRDYGPAAPVTTIARIAGVGTATLYRHFPSRDDLLTAMLGDQAHHRIAVLDDAVADVDPWRGFVTALETVVQLEIDNPGLSEAIRAQRHEIAVYEELRVRAIRNLTTLVARLRDAGIVRDAFEVADVLLILAALNGITDADPRHALSRTRTFIDHLAHGIKRPTSTPNGV